MLCKLPRTAFAARQACRTMATVSVESPLKQRPEGDIGSVFASLAGESYKPLPERYAELKRCIIGDEANAARLVASWKSLTGRLTQIAEEVDRKGNSLIPTIKYEDLVSGAASDTIKKSGSAVVTGVVPRPQAEQWLEDVVEYVQRNPQVKGFPKCDKQVFEVYWSKPQLAARSHPRSLAAQTALLKLFSLSPNAQVAATPLTYADRLRVRHPGDSKFALGPHMDGGSIERWEDPTYRAVYKDILTGNWEAYDAYKMDSRAHAKQNLYEGAGACGVFRAFQGWTSLSSTGPGEGTLRVYPYIREQTAYILMRPLFRAIEGPLTLSREAYLSADNWELDRESTDFPNAPQGRGQECNDKTHPHLELDRTMVSIPRVEPGDQAWWHADVIHAVESKHEGTGPSAVMYIPAVPITEINAKYVRDQRRCFEARMPPPDFPGGVGESTFDGTGTPREVLGEAARQGMGLGKLPVQGGEGERRVREIANEVLGFSS